VETTASGLTLQQHQGRPATTSSARVSNEPAPASPTNLREIDSTSPTQSTAAVESHIKPSGADNLPRVLTQSLATLLHELESLSSLAEPILQDLLTEFIDELTVPDSSTRSPHERTQLDGTRTTTKTATTSDNTEKRATQPGDDAPARLRGEAPRADTLPHQSTQSNTNNSLRGEIPPDASAQRIASATRPHSEHHTIKEFGNTTTKTDDASELMRDGKIGKGRDLPPPQPLTSTGSSPQTPSSPSPVTDEARDAAARALSKAFTPPLSESGSQRPTLPLDPKLLNSYRELISTLLHQPGSLANQLEDGVFKSLITSLSSPLPQSSGSMPFGTPGAAPQVSPEGILFGEDDDAVEPFGRNALLHPGRSRGENAVQESEKSSRRDGTTRPAVGMSSLDSFTKVTEKLLSRAGESQGSGVIGSQSDTLTAQLHTSGLKLSASARYALGVISDPGTLAALQGAVVRRNYDALARRKRAKKTRSAPKREGEFGGSHHEEADLNNPSKESTGLTLLRAMMGDVR